MTENLSTTFVHGRDHSRMGKGISLTEEEMERLVELWNTRNEEDSFEE